MNQRACFEKLISAFLEPVDNSTHVSCKPIACMVKLKETYCFSSHLSKLNEVVTVGFLHRFFTETMQNFTSALFALKPANVFHFTKNEITFRSRAKSMCWKIPLSRNCLNFLSIRKVYRFAHPRVEGNHDSFSYSVDCRPRCPNYTSWDLGARWCAALHLHNVHL